MEGRSNNSKTKKISNPFEDEQLLSDPVCKLNLKETSDFVRSFPNANNSSSSSFEKKLQMQPSTPGRPVFSFSSSRKCGNFPSKWDDAEKWLSSSPAHNAFSGKQPNGVVFVEKSRVSVDKKSHLTLNSSSTSSSTNLDHNSSAPSSNGVLVLLKDKLTNNVVAPKFSYASFVFEDNNNNSNSFKSTMKDASTATATVEVVKVKHRDMGTEMTPIGSSTTSRCHTPIKTTSPARHIKTTSPARHNTPENRSGPLSAILGVGSNDKKIELQECHLAKLNIGKPFDSVTSSWSTREEEEEDVSKSLRHFEVRRSVSVSRDCTKEDEEKTTSCHRYQREEAKIQAWVNLQSAKAEAQSRKLEVKIQKMRSDLEEKLMKRMAVVHRKAEEWRAAAQIEHSEQIQKATQRALKMNLRTHTRTPNLMICSPTTFNTIHAISCGCFPCNNSLQ